MSVKVQWPMFSKKKPAWLQLPRTRNPFSLLHYSWFQVQEVGRRINPKIPIARFPQRYANSIGKLNERNSVPRDSAKRKSEEETSQEQEKPRKEEEASEQQERGKLFRIKSKFTKKRGNEWYFTSNHSNSWHESYNTLLYLTIFPFLIVSNRSKKKKKKN